MKPNMIKKWSVALLVAAGAAGLVGCNANQGGKKDAGAAALTEAEVPTDTENFDTGLTARSLSLVQNDVAQSMGDVISPISGALHVLDSHYATVSQNWTSHQNGGSADLHANEADRLNLVYNAIRDRFDGIYDNTGAAEVKTDVATVTIQNVVQGSTYTVTVASNTDFSVSNAATASGVSVSAVGMDDVEAVVSVTPDDKKLYTLTFAAVANGDATIDLHNVAGGYTVSVTDGTDTAAVTGGLKDDFAPLVALQHADRNGQDKTNYNNTNAPHDSLGMLIEFGEESTDEAGEPLNGQMQEFYPKLNLTASLYDECHKRAKSENLDVNVAAGQEPINASELDVNYYTTPLLATERSATINGVTYGTGDNGKCATEQNVGTTCATNRSDRFYNENDYTCWEGVSSANSCKYYVPEPGAATGFVEVTPAAANQSGYSIVTAGAGAGSETVPNTAAASLLTLATVQTTLGYTIPSTQSEAAKSTLTGTGISFQSPVDPTITYPSSIVFKGPANCEGTSTELARSVVVDLTDDVAPIAESAAGSAQLAWVSEHTVGKTNVNVVNHDGKTTTGNSLVATLGLWHLETPDQYYDAAVAGRNYQIVKNYDEDNDNDYADDWTLSTRKHHLVATFGDWRTIDENRRFISSSQDIVRGDTATLYGPRMEHVVNNNVYGPDSTLGAVNQFHFGLRAEDFVVDSESDGAVRDTLMKLSGEKDATNSDLVIQSGDATGVVFVDATPAMNKSTTSSNTGGDANNVNNDGSISFSFDQPVLAAANYPEHAYLDLIGQNYIYRVDMNSGTVVRGDAVGDDNAVVLTGAAAVEENDVSKYINGISGTLNVDESSTIDTDNTANSTLKVGANNIDFTATDLTDGRTLYLGSKIRITDVDPGFATADYAAGTNVISISGLTNGIIAEGSIIQIGNGERAQRYRIVDNTDGDGYVTVGSTTTGVGEFVITPPLRGSIASGRDVTVEKSSTHHLTADATVATVRTRASSVENAAIHPSIPSNYSNGATVTILNGIENQTGSDIAGTQGANEYVDAFGLQTTRFPPARGAHNVEATITVAGNTMTIKVADTVPDAAAANIAFPLEVGDDMSLVPDTDEKVDMGAFFNDLSHTSSLSVQGTAAVPSFFVNYEDIQDTNFNSWAKTDDYDSYDDGRSPLLVGIDKQVPKLQQGDIATGTLVRDSRNTFLYDVTGKVGITLKAAHGNRNLDDDDIIYTPGIAGLTYEAASEILFNPATNTVEKDYPLFWFWGYKTAAAAGVGNTQDALGGNVSEARAVLKLQGVSEIDTSLSQAYMYTPAAVDSDQADAAGRVNQFTDQCDLEEDEIDNYIKATPKVYGITRSASLAADYDATNPGEAAAVAVDTSNAKHEMTQKSDVFNVDADVNGNLQSDAALSSLIVGLPAYMDATEHNGATATWDDRSDTLVIEDVVLDGVPYTLHFGIPTYVAAAVDTATNTALVTDETANLPEMRIYRKVSLEGMNLMPSGNEDMCSNRNLRTGNLVEDGYDPTDVILTYREDLQAAPTVAWRDGDDMDANAGDTDGYQASATAALFATPVATLVETMDNGRLTTVPSRARVRLHDITETTDNYIGHDAQIDVAATDFAGNTSNVTLTLRLGHGAIETDATDIATVNWTIDDDNDDADTTAVATAVVRDPILNVIGTLGDIHNGTQSAATFTVDTLDTSTGSGDAVE